MAGAARIGDTLSDSDHIAQGSPDFFINNKPIALKGNATTGHGCFVPSTITDPVASTFFVNGIPVAFAGSTNVPHVCPASGAIDSGAVIQFSSDFIVE